MPKKVRAILVTDHQRSKLDELRWQRKTTLAGIVAELVEEYAAGTPDLTQITLQNSGDIKVMVGDNSWGRAKARAAAEGKSVSEAIRERIDALTD